MLRPAFARWAQLAYSAMDSKTMWMGFQCLGLSIQAPNGAEVMQEGIMTTSELKEPSDQLIDQIDAYLQDTNNRYAIALEGEWGSGKTRFIEKNVAEHLKKGECDLVRVSMFGVATADALYERIMMALVHLSDKSVKVQSTAKALRGIFGSIWSTFKKSTGLSVNVAVGVQSVVSLMLSKKHFLVFDDVERRSKESDDLALFGVMNELVERLGLKAMLVSNAWGGSDGQALREFDRDVREKLIWKVYPFRPSPSALARDILIGDCRLPKDLDVPGAILAGVKDSGCVNARAMIRAEKLIRDICRLDAVQDKEIASQNRFNALRDAVHFALLASMENAPSKPQNDAPAEWLSQEALEYDRKMELYAQYSDFFVIGKAFNLSGDVTNDDLEKGFKAYIEKRYPNNSDTLEVRRIVEKMRYVYDLNDEEVDSLAERYYALVPEAHYSADCLHDVLEVYYLLSDLGWECPFTQNGLIDHCKKVIDVDLGKAIECLSGPAFRTDKRHEKRALAEELMSYAHAELDKRVSSQLLITEEMGVSGGELARCLADAVNYDVSVLVKAKPRIIVKTFCRDDASNQRELYRFFVRLRDLRVADEERSLALAEWLREIKNTLEDTSAETKTGAMRRRWLLSALEELSDRYESLVWK